MKPNSSLAFHLHWLQGPFAVSGDARLAGVQRGLFSCGVQQPLRPVLASARREWLEIELGIGQCSLQVTKVSHSTPVPQETDNHSISIFYAESRPCQAVCWDHRAAKDQQVELSSLACPLQGLLL